MQVHSGSDVKDPHWCSSQGTAEFSGLEGDCPIPSSIPVTLPKFSKLPSLPGWKVRGWMSLLYKEQAQERKPGQSAGVQLSLASSWLSQDKAVFIIEVCCSQLF